MNSLLLVNQVGQAAIVLTIGIVVLAILCALGVLSILATVWKLVIIRRYKRFNKRKVAAGMSGSQVAQKMLEGLGLSDVKVEQASFWRALFVGNSYSPKKKTIYLRKNIFNEDSVTSVSLAAQKVAIAQRHHEGDKKIGVRSALMKMGYFAPFSIVPLMLLGVVLDFVVYNGISLFSIVFGVISAAYFIISFIIVILNLKIEKRACNTAVEFMQKSNLLTEDELKDAKYLYKTYITDYWIEFWYNIFFILWQTIKAIVRIFGSKSKQK